MLCERGSVRNPSDCARRPAGGWLPPDRVLPMWSHGTTLRSWSRTCAPPRRDCPELLDRAAAGEEIVITSDGRPKAKLVGNPTSARDLSCEQASSGPVSAKSRSPLPRRIIRQDRDGRD